MATAQTDPTSQSAIASELGKAIAYRKAKRMTSLAFARVPCKHRSASRGTATERLTSRPLRSTWEPATIVAGRALPGQAFLHISD
jgi:hypothetical protein